MGPDAFLVLEPMYRCRWSPECVWGPWLLAPSRSSAQCRRSTGACGRQAVKRGERLRQVPEMAVPERPPESVRTTAKSRLGHPVRGWALPETSGDARDSRSAQRLRHVLSGRDWRPPRFAALSAAVLLGSASLACGRPPAIPHAIQSQDDASCLSCHRDGSQGAPRTAHPTKANCVGCHTLSQPSPTTR